MQNDNTQGQGNWTYQEDNSQSSSPDEPITQPQSVEPVQWSASEFIDHHKNAGWYMAILGGFIVLALTIYIITRDWVSILFIGIILILFMIIAAKKPRQRTYTVDNQGIMIDNKFYSYNDFKSFSLGNEGAIGSIVFMPLKRLMPELTVYFAAADEPRIVKVLAANLPIEERRDRSVDKLMKKLHF